MKNITHNLDELSIRYDIRYAYDERGLARVYVLPQDAPPFRTRIIMPYDETLNGLAALMAQDAYEDALRRRRQQ